MGKGSKPRKANKKKYDKNFSAIKWRSDTNAKKNIKSSTTNKR